MKKVITYGTFDLFHEGHYRILERAKRLGDYLIVGVTTENYDDSRGKLNVQQSLMQRIENVKNSGLADEIVIEEYEGQKINDIQKYKVDIFAIGSDWIGKFDYLKEYCEVVYLERTKGVSSTEIRAANNGVLKIGIIGCNNKASQFVLESKYVSGVNVEGVYDRDKIKTSAFALEHELAFEENNLETFFHKIDAVFIAIDDSKKQEYIEEALNRKIHVLCEKPMLIPSENLSELYNYARENKIVFLEAIKTAFSPGFIRLISIAKSGLIGEIKNIDATITRLDCSSDEFRIGSMEKLASYPLLAMVKVLGHNIKKIDYVSYFNEENDLDLFTKFCAVFSNAVFTAKVGRGVKSEGDLII
ncbi:MAG TPA: glycerol-3-phosphate cytidylyltransferase, partial [Thermosipho africanus]|nr:glycerol-3-phosphate cytidylyltransferase [Thermosipho africanus]